ncbi:MAG: hypothetical protein R2911_45330 [Caldilineaceae bacterium]
MADRTLMNRPVSEYRHFSHFVTAKAPEIGVEAAKQLLYDETRQNFDAFLMAAKGYTLLPLVGTDQYAPHLGARFGQMPGASSPTI